LAFIHPSLPLTGDLFVLILYKFIRTIYVLTWSCTEKRSDDVAGGQMELSV